MGETGPTDTPNIPFGGQSNLRSVLRERSLASLYWFGKFMLGYKDAKDRMHLPFANFLQLHPWNGGPESSFKKVAWLHRGGFKSSFASVALPLWLLAHNRNLTIALFSAKLDHPTKWLRQIKRVITQNQYFRLAFDDIRPAPAVERPGLEKWDETEIIITRDSVLSGDAQASITACSIGSGQASQHFDYVIVDDPVNEKTAKSEREIARALDTYKYMDSLGRGWGQTGYLLVGTPYGRGDVLEWVMENQVKTGTRLFWGLGARGEFDCSPELKEKHPEVLVNVPVGPPVFPEKVPEEMLQQLEREDPEKYYLQYLCKAYDLGRNGFDLQLVGQYWKDVEGILHCGCELHRYHRHDLNEMSVVGMCDPAASPDKEACRFAIVIAAKGKCGCRFLLDEWAYRVDPYDGADKIIDFCNKWAPYLRNFGIEGVGFQRMLKTWLEQKQAEGDIPLGVTFHKLDPQGRSKDARVMSQQPVVKSALWHILPTSRLQEGKENLLWELSRFPLGKSRDLIDAGFGYCNDMWDLPEAFPGYAEDGRALQDLNQRHEQYTLPSMLNSTY